MTSAADPVLAVEPAQAAPVPEFANPLPLGLLGYGTSTVLLSLVFAGVFDMGTMVLSTAIFFGGVAQTIVAVLCYRRNDSFGVTAFGGYSFLWLSLAFLLIGDQAGWWPTQNSGTAMGWYLILWTIFTLGLFVGSFLAPRVLTLVLTLTWILLLVLAIANFTGSETLTKIGGWEGVATGASAIYLAFGLLLNEMYGRTILPLGEPLVASPAA